MAALKVKRIYAPVEAGDGLRILVDRVWPRGLTRQAAQVDLWLKEVAPSHELRKWFGHQPERWAEFRRRYFAELEGSPETLQPILEELGAGTVTLVYSARDSEHNQAVALRGYLLQKGLVKAAPEG
ncbi:MAG: DUF488 domain-containing protein [Anaerolineales bacterium]|nr:DUF488 domain-containing protein [Anaerolineales bacterium]